jgi:hypothetical protein
VETGWEIPNSVGEYVSMVNLNTSDHSKRDVVEMLEEI